MFFFVLPRTTSDKIFFSGNYVTTKKRNHRQWVSAETGTVFSSWRPRYRLPPQKPRQVCSGTCIVRSVPRNLHHRIDGIMSVLMYVTPDPKSPVTVVADEPIQHQPSASTIIRRYPPIMFLWERIAPSTVSLVGTTRFHPQQCLRCAVKVVQLSVLVAVCLSDN